ncbi:hypothetical protein DW708_12620 [Ruminococcus sp. AM27-11LB]|uniref:hypothetical protein n=1 Tax=Mediterraneibacter TaxID=2316020 RepID=UPI000E4B4EDF|nr:MULTISPECIES: hypothetical protein [Mediterraneibacter]RGH91248.1 hypothetical protein DW719_12190 [Ruminococcus sp. AM27-27]RGH93225.1 hypothetical protein DW708_12620 [Ruminococcus sp. AM27-11LB]
MRLKNRLNEALRFLSFAFYPKTTLIACVIFSASVITILGVAMALVPEWSGFYNIVFALTTGAIASFFVSFVIELSNNYRHNKLAWYELKEYYSTVMDYESHKQVMMKLTPHQRAEKKAHEEFVAAGGIEEIDEYDQPKDIIQITWERLPNMMPIFKQTLNDKKQFLSDIEIDELESIISEYKQIQSFIHRRILMSPMYYDVLNHPDENYLASIYPNDILKNMPAWIRKSLSSTESQKACERYVEVILSDFTLLSQYMENYEISQKGIDAYKDELDKAEAEVEPEDIDYYDVDFSEPEDEGTFKRQNEIIDQQMEQEERPFTSWVISESCQNIAESIDVLEQSIMKKPYYGMMIKYFSNSVNEPIDDIVSISTYEYEKRRLDKKLKKQIELSEK